MNPLIQRKKLVSCGRDPARSLPLRRGFLLIPLSLVCFALCQQLQSATDSPDPGAPPLSNTGDGQNALLSITSGAFNSAFGFDALLVNTDASFNTGVGAGALLLNNADQNTGVGAGALLSNVAPNNTAVGAFALFSNVGDPNPDNFLGVFNNAVGANSLFSNVDGSFNNAHGESALFSNINGNLNTAIGDLALMNNDSTGTGDGSLNTAVGAGALFSNTDGGLNNAFGASALENNTTGTFNQAMGAFALDSNQDGESNVAIGDTAFADNISGSFNTIIGELAGAGVEGDDNIYVGATAGLPGGGSESGTIRIGDPSSVSACYIAGIVGQSATGGSQVFIDADGKLGTLTSSIRFKEHIRPMDKASETLLALKPVTFCYKKEIDAKGTPQFGLVAEEVAKVSPDLVIKDRDGKPYTVRYEAVNAMLLNEFLKEHRQVQEQQKQIEQLTAQLKEQAEQIRKVNDKVEIAKPTAQMVVNHR
jgi:hypothetical protein